MSSGQTIVNQFATILAEFFVTLDRTIISHHMPELSAIVTLSMDYRRVFGDQSEVNDTIDESITDCALQMCFKFTEVELKNFLLKLSEWRDARLVDSDEDFHVANTSSSVTTSGKRSATSASIQVQ